MRGALRSRLGILVGLRLAEPRLLLLEVLLVLLLGSLSVLLDIGLLALLLFVCDCTWLGVHFIKEINIIPN